MNSGIILIDKLEGWTSFDVVAKIRGILEKELRQQTGERQRVKVGHAGTLDPFATGLLIILIGSATKEADRFLKLDKSYDAEFILGATSNTDDKEGEIKEQGNNPEVNQDQIINSLKDLTGEIEQIPPQFSAIKVKGKRAYKSARKSEHIELEPRTVNVKKLELINYNYPLLELSCDVGSGTYIRSLARDLGEMLGSGAYVNELRRTQVGTYNIHDALVIHDLNYELIQKSILPLETNA